MEIETIVHEGIRTLKPYVPGKPIEELAREMGLSRIIKLASNENPLGPSPKAITRMREVAGEMHRYPDGPALVLRDKLAARTGLPADAFFFGSGSNELLELALKTFTRPGDVVASAEITFAVYGILAQAHGSTYVTAPMDGVAYDLDALADVVNAHKARLVFLANPNNPTGSAFLKDELDRFLDAIPEETIVVYDAAYAEYANDDRISQGLELISERENVVVTRTLSKAYGLAGLRVGWGFTPQLADYINRVRQPFNLNRMAQEAAVAALDDEEFLQQVLTQNRKSIEFLRAELEQLGLETYRSHANFVLLKSPLPADELFEKMLHQGVIIRSMRGFGLPYHVRVNTGTDEENRIFLDALKQVLEENAGMTRVAIIGVGLIGGSLGLRWKTEGFADHVVGCGRNVDNLKTAMTRGCIDTYTNSAAEACREADLVVVATPVATVAGIFAEIAPVLTSGAVVTDVASVKQQIVADAQANLPQPARFVPGHPIAGTEDSGAAAAQSDLYEGKRWVLTPDAETDPEVLALVERGIHVTGAYTETMTPGRHDEVFAWVSHVPHVLAFALAGGLHDCEDALMQYGGGGLADFLRIAASDPVMWRDIFTANADAIVAALRKVQDKIDLLAGFAEQQDGEALRRTLDEIASATRASRGR